MDWELKWLFTLGIVGPYTAEPQRRETGRINVKMSSGWFFILVYSLDNVAIPMKCAMEFLFNGFDFQLLSKILVKTVERNNYAKIKLTS